jgi:type IV secretory pathway VirB2 component (pilin)
MKFLKNNILTIAALAFVLTMSLIGDAAALGSDDVMSTAQNKVITLFKSIKTIVFVVGGFGLIALAFSAIFGKVKWPWFAGLAFGLAVLAAAGAIVDYATGNGLSEGTSYGGNNGDLKDSFQ